MIICNTLFSSCASIYSTLSAATPPPLRRPTPAVVPRRSSPTVPVVSSPLRSCPPFDYVIPRAPPPGPQSSNYIHSVLRLSGSRGSNSVHLSLRTGCDSSDRTSCVFLFPPLSRPPPSVSSRLCLARRASVPAFGDRVVVSLSPSLPIFDPRRRCMCGPRRLPDGSGISEFPRACWAPAVWSGRREKD